MQAIIDIIKNNPTWVSAVIRQSITLASAFGLKMTGEQIASLMLFVETLTSIFQSRQTLPKTIVDQQVSAKVAHREMTGQTGTGTGLTPPRVPTEPSGTGG